MLLEGPVLQQLRDHRSDELARTASRARRPALRQPVREDGGCVCPASADSWAEDLAEGGVAERVSELFDVRGVVREGTVDVCEPGEDGAGWGCGG